LKIDEVLGKRLFDFAVRTVKYCRKLPKHKEYQLISYNLL